MKKQSNNIQDYSDFELMFPGKYLKAADIATAGKPVPLTIARIEPKHELKSNKGKSENKPCMFFRGTDKGVVLNKTNAAALAECIGRDPRVWIGCVVVFRVERVESFGKHVPAIRVDVQATREANVNGKRGQAAPEPPPQSWDALGGDVEPNEAELAQAALEAENA